MQLFNWLFMGPIMTGGLFNEIPLPTRANQFLKPRIDSAYDIVLTNDKYTVAVVFEESMSDSYWLDTKSRWGLYELNWIYQASRACGFTEDEYLISTTQNFSAYCPNGRILSVVNFPVFLFKDMATYVRFKLYK